MPSKPVFNLYGQLVCFVDDRKPEKKEPPVILIHPAPKSAA